MLQRCKKNLADHAGSCKKKFSRCKQSSILYIKKH